MRDLPVEEVSLPSHSCLAVQILSILQTPTSVLIPYWSLPVDPALGSLQPVNSQHDCLNCFTINHVYHLPCDIFHITPLLNSYGLIFQVPKQLLILSVSGAKCYMIFEFPSVHIRVGSTLSEGVFIDLNYLSKRSEIFKYDKVSNVIFV